MHYAHTAITDLEIPIAAERSQQHLLTTYASETNKVVSIWHSFQGKDLAFKPHPKSSSVQEIMQHQLLSERRFFGEFLGTPEPDPSLILPTEKTSPAFAARLVELAAISHQGVAKSRCFWHNYV